MAWGVWAPVSKLEVPSVTQHISQGPSKVRDEGSSTVMPVADPTGRRDSVPGVGWQGGVPVWASGCPGRGYYELSRAEFQRPCAQLLLIVEPVWACVCVCRGHVCVSDVL